MSTMVWFWCSKTPFFLEKIRLHEMSLIAMMYAVISKDIDDELASLIIAEDLEPMF
jgi:hypothetical protein